MLITKNISSGRIMLITKNMSSGRIMLITLFYLVKSMRRVRLYIREQSKSIHGCIFNTAILRSPSTKSPFLPFDLIAVMADKAASRR